jgi:serine protease
MSAFELMRALSERGRPEMDDDIFAAELIFGLPMTEAEVRTLVVDVLRGEADPLFASGSGEEIDDDWILELPHLRSFGFEAEGFALARELAREISDRLAGNRCLEGNFIPVDSLYGAVAAAGHDLLAGACDTARTSHGDCAWPHRETRIWRAWRFGKGEGVRIASIDTGYSGHPELEGSLDISRQINVVERNQSSDARDRFDRGMALFPGHGTTTKSVIASRGDVDPNTWQHVPKDEVTGAAPEALIVPVRATRSVITILQKRLPPAIRAAVRADCQVIAMCLGGPAAVRAVQIALEQAIAAGVVVVAAAGNCYPWVVFPGRFSLNGLALCLGAVGYGDRDQGRGLKPWARSPVGPGISVVAPGEDVLAARAVSASQFTYSSAQGTTLATSLTAGIAALWIGHHGHARIRAAAAATGTTVHAMFMEAAISTAYRVPHWTAHDGLKTGAGLVDAEAILSLDLKSLAAAAAARWSPGRRSTVDLIRMGIDRWRGDGFGLTPDQERECAAELIWLHNRSGAAVKARSILSSETLADVVDPNPSAEVAGLLESRPGMRSAVFDPPPEEDPQPL